MFLVIFFKLNDLTNLTPKLFAPIFIWYKKPFCRQDSEYIKEVIKPFDWTFTTDYKGTLTGKEEIIMRV